MAGARLLARPLAPRPQRAHAQARRNASAQRAQSDPRRLPLGGQSEAPLDQPVSRVSAVIPVLNGERYLREILEALAREGVDETLVIDSGSRDRSVAIARTAGATVLEVPRAEF